MTGEGAGQMTSQLTDDRAARAVTGGSGRGPRGQMATLSRSRGIRRCPIPRCPVPIDPTRLMCRKHWYQVPKPIRDQVWATWRSGQGARSREHKDAVRLAIAAVLAASADQPH
jgi:hypothetical protein